MPSDPTQAICRHFRTKRMFVHQEDGTPVVERTEQALKFPYCWCVKSGSDLGPDGQLAHRQACSQSTRVCFRGL